MSVVQYLKAKKPTHNSTLVTVPLQQDLYLLLPIRRYSKCLCLAGTRVRVPNFMNYIALTILSNIASSFDKSNFSAANREASSFSSPTIKLQSISYPAS
jgi:hypothetical protein